MPLTFLQCFCSKSSSSKALICQVQNVKCHLWNFGHCWVAIWRNKPGVDLCVSNLLKGTSGVKPWKAEGAKSPLGLWRLEGRKGRIEDWGWAAAVGNGRGCHPGEPWDFWTSTLKISKSATKLVGSEMSSEHLLPRHWIATILHRWWWFWKLVLFPKWSWYVLFKLLQHFFLSCALPACMECVM